MFVVITMSPAFIADLAYLLLKSDLVCAWFVNLQSAALETQWYIWSRNTKWSYNPVVCQQYHVDKSLMSAD